MNVTWVKHCFGINQTIRAVIKMYNDVAIDEQTLTQLCDLFNTRNNGRVPRVGEVFEIPVIVS